MACYLGGYYSIFTFLGSMACYYGEIGDKLLGTAGIHHYYAVAGVNSKLPSSGSQLAPGLLERMFNPFPIPNKVVRVSFDTYYQRLWYWV